MDGRGLRKRCVR